MGNAIKEQPALAARILQQDPWLLNVVQAAQQT